MGAQESHANYSQSQHQPNGRKSELSPNSSRKIAIVANTFANLPSLLYTTFPRFHNSPSSSFNSESHRDEYIPGNLKIGSVLNSISPASHRRHNLFSIHPASAWRFTLKSKHAGERQRALLGERISRPSVQYSNQLASTSGSNPGTGGGGSSRRSRSSSSSS